MGIAGPAPWTEFYHQVYWDVNAPLYYLLMYLWQAMCGQSDLAMRAPSLIFALATPLVLAFSDVDGLGRTERFTWASLAALWFPTVSYAQAARCFTMLFFISTLQTLAFIRLLARPSLRRATLWAILAALAILTHYDAIYLGALQGLIYLARHQMRAVRTWPAALAFAPAFGELLYHLPRIEQLERPGIAWYPLLTVPRLAGDLISIMGRWQCSLMLAIAVLAAVFKLIFFSARPKPSAEQGQPIISYRIETGVWLAVIASCLSAITLIVVGFLRPSYSERYLIPDGPGLLLGIVLVIAMIAGRRLAWALCVLVIGFAAAVCRQSALGNSMVPYGYNWEHASQVLERVRPRRLVFLWDDPVTPVEAPAQLAAAGDAFFRRDGFKLAVDPVIINRGENPNRRLLASAAPPRSVIIWLYDLSLHDTAAVHYPPRISSLDPAWTCRPNNSGSFHVLACWRKSETP